MYKKKRMQPGHSVPASKARLTFFGAILFCPIISGSVWAGAYIEQGKSGDPASWRSNEFNRQEGLGLMNADQAYAAGYTGKGIKIGIFDSTVYAGHPSFSGQDKVINLVTHGIREYTDPYIPVKKGDAFLYDGTPYLGQPYPWTDERELDTHGTHVAGIAAGNRGGHEMHGVAYNAQIFSAVTGDPGPEDGIVAGNDGGVYKPGWDALIASGVRVINNSWSIGIPEDIRRGNLNDSDLRETRFTPDEIQKQFNQIQQILGTRAGGAYQGAIDAARSGIVNVFAAGNNDSYNPPDALAGLPYFMPDLAPDWLSVVSTHPRLNKQTQEYEISRLDDFSTRCGYTASFCVASTGFYIYSSTIEGDDINNPVSDYYYQVGTSMAAPQVTGSLAVLMERFPYMSGAQVASVLKTTATDLGEPGIDELYGWGLVNLGKAINGPAMLVTEQDIPEAFRISGAYGPEQFVADLPGIGAVLDKGKPTERICDSILCGLDVWSNDISGHGGLTKLGTGTLALSGTNTYSGPTLINQGVLAIDGSVTSDVTVQESGTLGGTGRAGSLTVRRGGTVAPGNSIGTFNVDGNVHFEPGSHYRVEVAENGLSDRILSDGAADIQGGEVAVSLQNTQNLLSLTEVRSLLGQHYTILTASQGVSGQFDAVKPDYLFLGTHLFYQPTQVTLSVDRNELDFVRVAQTNNEREVAAAAERLTAGHPVYESILRSGTVNAARRAFRQLSGQIHADSAAAAMNDSRYLRDAVNSRLRQAEGLATVPGIKADDEGGAWAQLLGAWDHASGTANSAGYQASTYGVLVGLDAALAVDGRLGLATGYTQTKLKGGHGSNTASDNYHLALYGDKQLGALALRTGGGYSWHRFDTHRTVSYDTQFAGEKAKYNARTSQLFTEAGYTIKHTRGSVEPFAHLAYVNFGNNGFSETGGAAALHADKQHTDATLSTLGLRADARLPMMKTTEAVLRGELGWQHQYGTRARSTGLSFSDSRSPFVVGSVPVSRDGAVLKSSMEMAVNNDATLSLGYSGLLSASHQDNSVNAGFTWSF